MFSFKVVMFCFGDSFMKTFSTLNSKWVLRFYFTPARSETVGWSPEKRAFTGLPGDSDKVLALIFRYLIHLELA